MKNNTNQIMKLDLPIWIKYWLAKHKNISYILSEILTGTEFFLQDSAPKKFKMFDIIGRTTQESTTGKNKLKVENVGTYNGITSTKNTDGSINLKGTCTGAWFKVNDYDNVNIPAGTYTFSIDTTLEKYIRLNFVYEDDTVANGFVILAGQKKATQTIDKKIIKIFIEFPSATNFSIDTTVKFQLEQGSTATDYEPYTGGEPAPNPNYEMPIKNTGDNGSVNEKVQNKNLCSFTNQDFTLNGVRYYVQDGNLYFNGTSTSETLTNNVAFKNNFAFILKAGNYKLSRQNVNGTQVTIALKKYSDDNNIITLVNAQNNSVTFTLTEETKVYIGFYVYNKTFTNEAFSIQIEQGSTATDYIAHSEQKISFPLAQGQKLMEGDYLADDGIHSLWNEDTVNGTTSTFSDAKTNGAYYCNQKVSGNLTGQTITFDTSVTNAIVQYELEQEQVIPYTEEQKTAWEQIKKARTYKNITHISSEDETPAELKIQYYKEG